MADTIYAKGLYGKKPSEKAPDFIVGSLSVKVDDFIPFLNEHKNEKGYVNLTIKKGKEDRLNIALDTWKPSQPKEDAPKSEPKAETPQPAVAPQKYDDGLPF